MTTSQHAKVLEAETHIRRVLALAEKSPKINRAVVLGNALDAHLDTVLEALSIMRAVQVGDSAEVAIDQAHYSEQLTKAKRLIVDVWQRYPSTRKLIEGRTGRWFVWGENRDATPEGNRQYYYRNPACKADFETDPGCLCWHDEGTGPGVKHPEMIRAWRAAPPTEHEVKP